MSGALRADRHRDAARGAVEALLAAVVADLEDRSRTMVGDVGVAGGGDSPAMWTCPVGDQRLDGDAAGGVLREQRVEDRVEMASAILSGCPSVTDSDVNRRRDTEASPTGVAGSRGSRAVPSRQPSGQDQPGRRATTRSQNDVGQRVLAASGTSVEGGRRRPARPRRSRRPRSRWVAGLAHLVDDEQVAALAGQLGAPVVEHRAVVVAGLRLRSPRAPGRRSDAARARPARPGSRPARPSACRSSCA
jgi:hypothetical protein